MVGFTRNNMKWPNLDASKKVKHGTTSVFSTNSQVTEMLITWCSSGYGFVRNLSFGFSHHEMLVVMDVAKPLAHRYWPIPIDVDNHNILRSVWWLNPRVCSLNCDGYSFIFHWTNKSLNFSKSTISFLPQVSKNRNFSVLWTVEPPPAAAELRFCKTSKQLAPDRRPFPEALSLPKASLAPRQARQGCPKPQQEREPWPCIDLDTNIYTMCIYIYTYIWYV